MLHMYVIRNIDLHVYCELSEKVTTCPCCHFHKYVELLIFKQDTHCLHLQNKGNDLV